MGSCQASDTSVRLFSINNTLEMSALIMSSQKRYCEFSANIRTATKEYSSSKSCSGPLRRERHAIQVCFITHSKIYLRQVFKCTTETQSDATARHKVTQQPDWEYKLSEATALLVSLWNDIKQFKTSQGVCRQKSLSSWQTAGTTSIVCLSHLQDTWIVIHRSISFLKTTRENNKLCTAHTQQTLDEWCIWERRLCDTTGRSSFDKGYGSCSQPVRYKNRNIRHSI